jgi:hypothetical protein
VRTAIALLVLTAATTPLRAQLTESRSGTYLFSAAVEDARAMWVNPAGLGIIPLASLYAEVAADRTATNADWGMRQYSFGLMSRSLAFGYQRDNQATGGHQGTWRLGAGIPLGRRIALGTGVSFTSPERGIDLGLRASPARPVDIGLVVRNIGRPNVNAIKQRITAVGGIAWRFAQGRFGIQWDAVASERPDSLSGFDVRHRTGATVLIPGRTPFTLLTALDWSDHLRVTQWSVGIGFGFTAQALMVGTSLPQSGSSTRLDSFNVTAIARGRPQARR